MHNRGKPWTQEEINSLLKNFDSGLSIEQMIVSHGRTGSAIVTKLMMLNRLVSVNRGYRIIQKDEWVSFKKLNEIQPY